MTNSSQDNFDRVLAQEDTIVPSSGFVARVMDAVEQEATAPAPIRFPWKRALPGLAACLALAAVLIVNLAAGMPHSSGNAYRPATSDRLLPILHQIASGSGTLALSAWLVIALLISLGTMQLSMRIAGGGK